MTSKGEVDTLSAALLFAGALLFVVAIACGFVVVLRRQLRLNRRDDESEANEEAEAAKSSVLGMSVISLSAADQFAATEAWLAVTEKALAEQPSLPSSPKSLDTQLTPWRPPSPSSDSDSRVSSTLSCMSDGGATVTPPPFLVRIHSTPTALPALPLP